MQLKLGINGLGRIGSMAVRACLDRLDKDSSTRTGDGTNVTKGNDMLSIVGINDPFLSPESMAYFLKYDSVHGRTDYEFTYSASAINVLLSNGSQISIPVFNEKDPNKLPWSRVGAETILECTGQFLTQETAQGHIHAGANYVVMSAPSKDKTPMYVMGVNHDTYKGQTVVSNASCTTNCLAPIAKVLNDLAGVEAGLMTTVHATTASQKVADGMASNLRLGRAAFQNIIPSSTGAAKAVGKVLPELEGKLTGMAFRVPTQDVSVVDLTCQLKQDTDLNAICEAMKTASKGSLSGILGYTEEDLVSSDFIGESCTSIFDAKASICLTPRFIKVIAWYDNEWAYANKLLDLAAYMKGYNDKH